MLYERSRMQTELGAREKYGRGEGQGRECRERGFREEGKEKGWMEEGSTKRKGKQLRQD